MSADEREIERLVELLEPHAKVLDSTAELLAIRRTLDHGASYERQRKVYKHEKSYKAVAEALVDEFKTNQPVS